jgi:ribose transport system permease protein
MGQRDGTKKDGAIRVERNRVRMQALKSTIAGKIRIPRERRGVWILNAALLVVLAFAAPDFYSTGNIETVLGDTAILGIVAAGMTVLIMAGAFDLSVTSIMGLGPIVAVTVAGDRNGLSLMLLSVLTGAGLGVVNGLIITRGRVAPFVATLGTLFVFGSVADIISNGNALTVTNSTVLKLGTGSIGPLLPYTFLIMLVVFGVCHILLRRLHLGRWVRASGSNLRAAHVAGIDVRWVYFSLFVISGALTGLAGILLSGYLASADATQAPNYNLSAIAVVVVGGTSLRGGEGTLVGTALAAWLFAVVGNGLVLVGMNSYWQYVATGIIVVLALIMGKIGFGGAISWPRRHGMSGSAPPESRDVPPAAPAVAAESTSADG